MGRGEKPGEHVVPEVARKCVLSAVGGLNETAKQGWCLTHGGDWQLREGKFPWSSGRDGGRFERVGRTWKKM